MKELNINKKTLVLINITVFLSFTYSILNASSSSLKQLWLRCQESLPPLKYKIIKDEIVPSSVIPSLNLRRIELRFSSQVVGQWERRMEHTAIIHLPALPEIYSSPEKKGKVVIIAGPCGDSTIVDDYGEPIASRMGYPTMVLSNPGEYDGQNGESCWVYFFRSLLLDTRDPINHQYFRFAIPYLRAIDIFENILQQKNIKAIIGGHSKRAPAAFNAAALGPDRVAGVIYMGMESIFADYEGKEWECISPVHSQEEVRCHVFYIGATNEDGYEMFNITRLMSKMRRPWTIEIIPNFHHATYSEIQALDWMMWIAHLFESRPLTQISDLRFEENEEGTIFRAKIDSPNKILQAKVWYVYCDDVPYWRDLMWYPVFLKKTDSHYEAFVSGKIPDAWFVEVKDIAGGYVGYVSSLPQNITGKPTKERYSRGWKSRLWEPKTSKQK